MVIEAKAEISEESLTPILTFPHRGEGTYSEVPYHRKTEGRNYGDGG